MEERDVEEDEEKNSVVSMMVVEVEGEREEVEGGREEVEGEREEVEGGREEVEDEKEEVEGEREKVEVVLGIEVEGMEIGEGETVVFLRRCEHSNWQCHKSNPVAR